MSPQGQPFNDAKARSLSREPHLIFVCGRYEGVDQRAFGMFDEEISIGDYVLTGGELPAMVVAEAVARLVPGVLKEEATTSESFAANNLDFPQYTRPRVWRGKTVPEVLVSGDHKKISSWRSKEAAVGTAEKRPDLLKKRG
jgi:tRNA (guanine37-N1)-methyltransferase